MPQSEIQGLDRIFKPEQTVKKESDLYRRNKGLGEPHFGLVFNRIRESHYSE
jgi:hypothetical protein